MWNEEWYDVIVRENGERNIEFSCKEEEDAMNKAKEFHENGAKTYIAHFTMVKSKLSREIIDPFGGYKPYEMLLENETPKTKVKKKKHVSGRDMKKSFKF